MIESARQRRRWWFSLLLTNTTKKRRFRPGVSRAAAPPSAAFRRFRKMNLQLCFHYSFSGDCPPPLLSPPDHPLQKLVFAALKVKPGRQRSTQPCDPDETLPGKEDEGADEGPAESNSSHGRERQRENLLKSPPPAEGFKTEEPLLDTRRRWSVCFCQRGLHTSRPPRTGPGWSRVMNLVEVEVEVRSWSSALFFFLNVLKCFVGNIVWSSSTLALCRV